MAECILGGFEAKKLYIFVRFRDIAMDHDNREASSLNVRTHRPERQPNDQ